MYDPADYIIHDLTLPYSEQISGFSSSQARTLDRDGWNATWLKIYSHAGTHMDAPWHFEVRKSGIDAIPIERFWGCAWVIHVPCSVPQTLLGIGDVEEQAKDVKPGDSIILRTGWSAHFGTDAYRDGLPRISEDLAHWIVERKINMLLVEPPSVADVNNLAEVTTIHNILMQGDVLIVEGICNVDGIRSNRVSVMALPLKIKDCDGSPARVLAFEPKLTTS